MVAMEFGRFQWPRWSETEQYGSGGRRWSFFINFDFRFVHRIAQFQVGGFGKAFQIGIGVEQIADSHAFQHLQCSENVF